MTPKINLDDASLFGNDAAEDEVPEVFDAYFMHRPEVDRYKDVSSPLRFLRAYRGEGKSAIIRHTFRSLSNDGIWAKKITGSAIAPQTTTEDPSVWSREWQKAILGLLAAEIGHQVGVAWTDDAMTLVEQAERTGFRQKSFVSSILSRLNIEGRFILCFAKS